MNAICGTSDVGERFVVSSTRGTSGSWQSGRRTVERGASLMRRADHGSPRSTSPISFPGGPLPKGIYDFIGFLYTIQ